jgi:hypothetical protein
LDFRPGLSAGLVQQQIVTRLANLIVLVIDDLEPRTLRADALSSIRNLGTPRAQTRILGHAMFHHAAAGASRARFGSMAGPADVTLL